VVCDGVSTSQAPDVSSAAAAEAACAALVCALHAGGPVGPAAMREALRAAEDAVSAIPYRRTPGEAPPETTIVAAVRQGGRVTLGWLGDSRAYLVGPGGARQLTEDHSWVNEVVAAGEMTPAEALRSPRAHGITRTLGGHPVNEAADEPSLLTLDLPAGPSHLVLCSDGLWNDIPEPWQLAALVNRNRGGDALALARALVEYACGRQAHDNITAAVLACQSHAGPERRGLPPPSGPPG
jgi:serine/threonine protein phosphatase PrpC